MRELESLENWRVEGLRELRESNELREVESHYLNTTSRIGKGGRRNGRSPLESRRSPAGDVRRSSITGAKVRDAIPKNRVLRRRY